MGKRILQQRAGRGSPTFRSPSHIRVAPAKYPSLEEVRSSELLEGYVKELVHDPGRWTPLAHIVLENGVEFYTVAVEGISVGSKIYLGEKAPPLLGSIKPLKTIPEGTKICNIELLPGDGGKIARTAGSYAVVIGRSGDKVIVQLPSGVLKEILGECRATIGVPAGAGRTEKPLLKAGASYHKWKVKARKWPRVRGVAMNPVSHKFGGGSHQSPSHPSTVSRTAPPGRKVGHIAARRTGRRKR
ncbi:MAG: 50S ribosomal protein L2 [Desulfurococcales archaeon]|jgi:large subunit ribosomal protein L2|nr:50S ribosomal protein L2 [Desulfurococcales archaeon]NAZ13310.1 50S ribosomal protein L2 [Desulfurococcales archaeon]